MGNLSRCKLVVRKGEEGSIPKGGLEVDSRYFDLDSLVRMYGVGAVESYFHWDVVKKGSTGE